METDELLDILQPVFRGITLAMAAANKERMPQMALALQAVAAAAGVDDRARIMLLDLSSALEALGPGRPQ